MTTFAARSRVNIQTLLAPTGNLTALQRISISEDDLSGAPAAQPPAVYAPVGGARHPDVYGPMDSEAPEREGAQSRVPAWLLALAVAVLVLSVAAGAFLLGRGGRVSDAELQRQLSVQRTTLTQQADQAERQAARMARADAERSSAARLRAATGAARAEGRRAGYDDGYAKGLAAGRGETCTGLVC